MFLGFKIEGLGLGLKDFGLMGLYLLGFGLRIWGRGFRLYCLVLGYRALKKHSCRIRSSFVIPACPHGLPAVRSPKLTSRTTLEGAQVQIKAPLPKP